MRKVICIAIAAIGFGMVETGTAGAQTACRPGQVYNGRACVTPTTRRTDRAVTSAATDPAIDPAPGGYGFYRRNPGNPCGDPHLTIQEGACRGY